MRGITLGVFSVQPTYDVDFQTNVLDVAQTMGYAIPPSSTLSILNRLMVDMKDIGFYQIQDTLANFALGVPAFNQFSMIDWKKVGNIYSVYGGMSYEPHGIHGNGVNAYVDTNFNPVTMGVNYTLDYASRGAIVYHQPYYESGTASVLDSNTSGISNILFQLPSNANSKINGGTTLNSYVDTFGTGLKSITRSLDNIIVTNITDEQYRTNSGRSMISLTQVLFMYSSSIFSETGASCYFMGGALDNTVAQNFRTIYNQFLSDSGLSPIA